MGSIDEIQQVCRLCLDKDEVNIPIFDESSDARQTFLKISACLPVKVSRDDNLPKNICDGCSCKLDMLYVFRNTSVDSEKQLIQWLNQAGLSVPPSTAVRDGAAKPEILVKQEAFDSSEMSEAQNYLIQQQKLTYSEEFAFGEVTEDSPGDLLPENEEPSPKRARRSTAKRQPVLDDTDDDEMDSMHITKAEADEDDSDDGDQADYGDTASADDQPGPSGVNRSGADAPSGMGSKNGTQQERMSYKIPIILHKQLQMAGYSKIETIKSSTTTWISDIECRIRKMLQGSPSEIIEKICGPEWDATNIQSFKIRGKNREILKDVKSSAKWKGTSLKQIVNSANINNADDGPRNAESEIAQKKLSKALSEFIKIHKLSTKINFKYFLTADKDDKNDKIWAKIFCPMCSGHAVTAYYKNCSWTLANFYYHFSMKHLPKKQ